MLHLLLRRQTLYGRVKALQSLPSCRTDSVVAFVWVIYPWDTRYRRTTKQPQCLLFRHYIVLGEPTQTPLSTHGAQHSAVSTVGKHYKQRSSYQRIATEPIRQLLPWHFIMFRVQNRPTLSLLSAGALWEASGSPELNYAVPLVCVGAPVSYFCLFSLARHARNLQLRLIGT